MDINRPVEERVEALLKQMTLTEKIGQMDMVSEWDKDAIIKTDIMISEHGLPEWNRKRQIKFRRYQKRQD